MNIYHSNKLPGRIVETSDGQEFLWFSGTDYLGMGHNEDLRRHLQTATETFGNHYGSSRNNSLRLSVYDDAERQLADFLQTKALLIVSSGMWAGQLLMKEIEAIALDGSNAISVSYYYAPGVHPALWGNAFDRTYGGWHEWASRTVQQINESAPEILHIICSDAVGSPTVKAFDFNLFNALENPQNVWLIIDESHSLGVFGTNGRGISSSIGSKLWPQTMFASSLNKAMGIPAGAIWGAESAIEIIRKSPWFAGASPPAPAYVYALKTLLEEGIYSEAHALLMEKVSYFSQKLVGNTLFESLPDYPVFCSDNAALFDHLLRNGMMASCFPYPSPADAPVTRIAISSLHQKEDLDQLAEVCKRFIG
ncbi:aminotransferase class I/II-fold pyridoxal phosphate-dependent enzyme [Dyadobacter sp. CY261]|uniref:aminotransferase class I/II-fold pyridoxal phosphate-dependent enzyme n=1 Tax=Dyadobacter sp. CY261 TaxID=2907203 RepID=UPI001F2155C1|nr:aminotransferase class I/II-fold pyridoxal phosphate-dependent enzyme [Dyadobacter sp. CY261]MCF0072610.1 aminotransferase class I/II-fold pyridoxal phosphate-dependent enzyme [Dyadobacter sp. CY261]